MTRESPDSATAPSRRSVLLGGASQGRPHGMCATLKNGFPAALLEFLKS